MTRTHHAEILHPARRPASPPLPPPWHSASPPALRAEGGTAAQLRAGAVTDADLEGAGLSDDARAAVAT